MNNSKKYRSIVMAAGLAAALTPLTALTAEPGPEIGILKCRTVEGTGKYLVVYSSSDVECTFTHTKGSESYTGKTGIGLGWS